MIVLSCLLKDFQAVGLIARIEQPLLHGNADVLLSILISHGQVMPVIPTAVLIARRAAGRASSNVVRTLLIEQQCVTSNFLNSSCPISRRVPSRDPVFLGMLVTE